MSAHPSDGCVDCGALFYWQGPGESGRVQGWRRASEPSKRGDRCADRSACKARRLYAEGITS